MREKQQCDGVERKNDAIVFLGGMMRTKLVNATGVVQITSRWKCLHCGTQLGIRTSEQTWKEAQLTCETCGAIYTVQTAVTKFHVMKPWRCWNCGQEIRPNITHDTSACTSKQEQ